MFLYVISAIHEKLKHSYYIDELKINNSMM